MSQNALSQKVWVIVLIMSGVLVWGIFHAIGAYRLNHNPWRGVIVLGFSLGFLGLWLLLLVKRGRQTGTPKDDAR